MNKPPRFLIAHNPAAQPGETYILHTQPPAILVRVVHYSTPDAVPVPFSALGLLLVQQYQPTPEVTPVLRRMADWYAHAIIKPSTKGSQPPV